MSDTAAAIKFSFDNEIDYVSLFRKVMQLEPSLAMDILQPDLDYFAAELLKRRPELFLQLSKQLVSGVKRAAEIKIFMQVGNAVGAIKVLREDTGLGLKEAKDVIVTARDQLVALGLLPAPANSGPGGPAPLVLEPALQAMCNGIIAEF